MVRPVYQGRIETGEDEFDIGLSDLAIIDNGDGARVVAWAPHGSGLVGLELGEGAHAIVSDIAQLNNAQAAGANRALSVIEQNGEKIIVTGSAVSTSTAFILDAQGDFDGISLPGVGASQGGLGGMVDMAQSRDGGFYALSNDGVLSHFRTDGDDTYSGSGHTVDVDGPMALHSVQMGNTDYVLAAGRGLGGVVAFRVNESSGAQGGRLDATGAIGADEGVGIMTPTAMDVTTMLGKTFVVLLSADSGGGQGGAISVLELTALGELVPVDHANDTRDTRFGAASALEVIEANGRVQVIAGGGDDGMTMFDLTPDGRLLHQVSIANDGINGLDNVQALVATQIGDEVQVFTTSQSAPGIGQWSYGVGDMTAAKKAQDAGGVLAGGGGDDLLAGGAGNDRITGGAGDDILIGGQGRDTLSGGAGRDTFMLEPDASPDHITDFEVGQDRIDMSRFRMLYDADQLGFVATASGAVISWHEQSITVTRAGGGTLSLDQLFADGFNWATHSYLPSDFPEVDPDIEPEPDPQPEPNPEPEPKPDTDPDPDTGVLLEGSDDADIIHGSVMGDTLRGQDGDDTITGGSGDDYLHGNNDNDVLYGGSGDDIVIGGKGNARLTGNNGDDELTGGNGHDTLLGGDGDDLIFAQAGDDVVYGGNGADSVHLGIGSDTYFGNGSGGDVVRGLAGHDTIIGGSGDDVLLGHRGHDVIDGAGGNDSIVAGIAHDHISGGTGNDFLNAGPGWDTIVGGNGNDTLIGSLGNDTMTGGAGADTFVFTARSGWDTVTDYNDSMDILSVTFQGQSFDKLAMFQDGANVNIWYGSGGIVLEGTDLHSLDADDFLFS